MNRHIVTTINAVATSDGDGVKISRSIGSHFLPQLDPFLLLDELKSEEAADYIGGFPPHPHRGFETVTYMLEGQIRHKDSAGNEGVVHSGDVQWMSAGSGIIHSEMPEQKQGRLWGFQLWTNLPAEQKMRSPRYQEIASQDIPELTGDFGRLRIIAGDADGIAGPITNIATQPLLLDLRLAPGGEKSLSLPVQHTAIVYLYRGEATVGDKSLSSQQLGHLSEGDSLQLKAGEQGAGALILAAEPLGEPIARAGPFVMNTEDELKQAYHDYQTGRFALVAPSSSA
ncbi:MAG: pirin family protein [Pseudomonadota bacterium]